MARPKQTDSKTLTETETFFMKILWDLGKSSIHQIQEKANLNSTKDYAYTTVSTVIRVLERKKYVLSEKLGRGHIYWAAISKSQFQKSAVDHFIDQFFGGKPSGLVRNLIGKGKISDEELQEIKELLDEASK